MSCEQAVLACPPNRSTFGLVGLLRHGKLDGLPLFSVVVCSFDWHDGTIQRERVKAWPQVKRSSIFVSAVDPVGEYWKNIT